MWKKITQTKTNLLKLSDLFISRGTRLRFVLQPVKLSLWCHVSTTFFGVFGALIKSILPLIIPLWIKPPFPTDFIDDAVEHGQIYESKNAAGNWASVDIQLDESGYSGVEFWTEISISGRINKVSTHVCMITRYIRTSKSVHGDDAILSDEQTVRSIEHERV